MWLFPKNIDLAWVSAKIKNSWKSDFSVFIQKNQKIPMKMKIYNFKNFVFEFSSFFWYDSFFSLRKVVGKSWFYSRNNIFCHLILYIFWWMTLDCFACISVFFRVIKSIRKALESFRLWRFWKYMSFCKKTLTWLEYQPK